MLGIEYIRVQPTHYVLQFRGGKVIREGAGLSFFFFAPNSSLMLIPLEGKEAPFIFNEVTSDFQEVTVQGNLTYRVADPRKLARLANFTLDSSGRRYVSDDPQKFAERLIHQAQVSVRSAVKSLALRDALTGTDTVVRQVRASLLQSEFIQSLGVEVLDLSILAIRPTPETARALEADIREQLLRRADEAVYVRRNAAVEQERVIKENELNTEIAVENKKRLVMEAKMDAERAVQEKRREMREAEIATQVTLEQKKRDLVALTAENTRQESDARSYALSAILKPLASIDPQIVQSLASAGMDPGQLVAHAFRQLAENAERIGQLNITPDLLRELVQEKSAGKPHEPGNRK